MNPNTKTIAVLMLHADCDMRCKFCITDNQLECMSLEQYTHTLDRLENQGFNNLVLGGGEPFCWPHGLPIAAKRAKERGFCVQVGTNGIAMPDDEAYPQWVDRYVLPLDSFDPRIHNWVRPLPGNSSSHFALIMQRLEQMKQYRRIVTVSTVISRANLDGVIAIGDFLADYVASGGRLHAWHLYRFIPEGRGGRKNALKLGISTAEFDAAVVQAKNQFYPFTIFKRPNMRHSATVDFFWYEAGKRIRGSKRWQGETRLSAFRPVQKQDTIGAVAHATPFPCDGAPATPPQSLPERP